MPENKVGRAYARPRSGTARRPEKNASARPSWGVLQRCLFLETGGFDLDQQPKRREIALVVKMSLSSLSHQSLSDGRSVAQAGRRGKGFPATEFDSSPRPSKLAWSCLTALTRSATALTSHPVPPSPIRWARDVVRGGEGEEFGGGGPRAASVTRTCPGLVHAGRGRSGVSADRRHLKAHGLFAALCRVAATLPYFRRFPSR